jgi:hypothetical protein
VEGNDHGQFYDIIEYLHEKRINITKVVKQANGLKGEIRTGGLLNFCSLVIKALYCKPEGRGLKSR